MDDNGIYHEFDERSDLLVLVLFPYQPQPASWLCSSHALIRASPVLEELILTARQQLGPSAFLDLQHEDPVALRFLFNIAHLNFRDVPYDLHIDTFVNLANLVLKYECMDLISPWAEHWMKRHDTQSSGMDARKAKLLTIAWNCGFTTMVHDLIDELMFDMYLQGQERIEEYFWTSMIEDGQFDKSLMPDVILSKQTCPP
jgi:hypothetical protein